MHLFIVMHAVPIPTIIISPSGPIQGAMVGSSQVINCTVSTVNGVESSSVMISWMGPRGAITNSNDRISIRSVTDDGNNMHTSSLQLTYLMEGDEGTYTCNVMILDTSGSQSVPIQSLTGNELDYYYCINIHVLLIFYMHSSHSNYKCDCPQHSDSGSATITTV